MVRPLGLFLDPSAVEPLYKQIFDQVVSRIRSQAFPPGYRLPPTRILARELAPTVRVNAVAPGTVLFPEDYDATAQARVLARVPLGRQGQPGDVARAVRFLLSESYLTGVCLPVDGGQGLR